MGVAGFVLSLVGLVLCWVPLLNVILCTLGFIFSFIGVCLPRRRKGLAIAGLIITLVLSIVVIIVMAEMWLMYY